MKRFLVICLFLFLPMAAQGTVTNQSTSVSFTCTGSTGPYAFAFPISDPTAMTVIQNGTTLASTTYTIVAVNNDYTNGGAVTLNSTCPNGQTLVLQRNTPLLQLSVFQDNMPIPMKTFERSLDKLTEADQDLLRDVTIGTWTGVNNFTNPGNTFVGAITDAGGQVYNVKAYGSSPTAIALTVTSCGANPCVVHVPMSYTTTEQVPGSGRWWLSESNFGGTGSNPHWFEDYRYGGIVETAINPRGKIAVAQPAFTTWKLSQVVLTEDAQATGYQYRQGSTDSMNTLDGGANICCSPYTFKYQNRNKQWYHLSTTPGEHHVETRNLYNNSIGDAVADHNLVTCYGGINAAGDEGCEAQDNWAMQGATEFVSTVVAHASTGSTSITLDTPSLGDQTQGAGRFLGDVTNALSAGTITAIGSSGNLAVYTGNSTSWPVSTVTTTLGTAVTAPGTATVTPGLITGITTSTLLCIAGVYAGGANNFEMLIPSAVVGATFTATFQYPHLGTAVVGSGGLCGYGIELSADDYATGTDALHQVWPVVYSSSSTSAHVWVNQQGFNSYPNSGVTTEWQNSSSAAPNGNDYNSYVAYPIVQVKSVTTAGQLSYSWTTTPQRSGWTVGDTVRLFHYPAMSVHTGNDLAISYFPTIGGSGSSIGAIRSGTMIGLWHYPQGAEWIDNQTPTTWYANDGGNLRPPRGLTFNGGFSPMMSDIAYDPATVGMQFTGSPYGTPGAIIPIEAWSAVGYGLLRYDQTVGSWQFYTGGSAAVYDFGPTAFTVPVQIQSSLTTGTAPLTVASTTPVTNLTASPAVYNTSGTQATNVHIVQGSCAIASTCAITLSGSAVFTSSSSYECWARDSTDPTKVVTVRQTSGSGLAFTGTGTDTVHFGCTGN